MREGLLVAVGLLLAMGVVQVANRPAAREWLASPGREWLRARLAQRWADGHGPRRLTRRYWSEREYQADISRLEPLGFQETEHRDFAAERERILRVQESLPVGVLRGNPPVEPPLPFCIVVWERAGLSRKDPYSGSSVRSTAGSTPSASASRPIVSRLGACTPRSSRLR